MGRLSAILHFVRLGMSNKISTIKSTGHSIKPTVFSADASNSTVSSRSRAKVSPVQSRSKKLVISSGTTSPSRGSNSLGDERSESLGGVLKVPKGTKEPKATLKRRASSPLIVDSSESDDEPPQSLPYEKDAMDIDEKAESIEDFDEVEDLKSSYKLSKDLFLLRRVGGTPGDPCNRFLCVTFDKDPTAIGYLMPTPCTGRLGDSGFCPVCDLGFDTLNIMLKNYDVGLKLRSSGFDLCDASEMGYDVCDLHPHD